MTSPLAPSVPARSPQSYPGRRRDAGHPRRPGARALLPAAIAACLLAPAVAPAQTAPRFPVTPEQRETAERVAQAGVALSEIAPDAPARYTIKHGDTLWALSQLYLRSPWRWPELWGMNRTEVHNPHLIYPGQTLVLVREDGRAHLALAGKDDPAQAPALSATGPSAVSGPAGSDLKLRPQVRDEGAERALAIPSIPNSAIEAFLSQPQVVGASELDGAARIVATRDEHVYLGAGDSAYARGVPDGSDYFSVFRPARPLFAADDPKHSKPIAYEALYVGTVRLTQRGTDVSTIEVTRARQEIGVGDRLLPVVDDAVANYVPHHPAAAVDGHIIDVYGGVGFAGAESIVTLDRGRKDGLEMGHVLSVQHAGGLLEDPTLPKHPKVAMPDEALGFAFVFRVFESVSYALLVSSNGPVQVGDGVLDPETSIARAQGRSRP